LTGIVQSARSGKEQKEGVVHIVTSTVDISGAGMAIHHSAYLPIDTMFEAKLAIENNEPPLHLLARIVHSEPIVGLSNERQMYHIAFFFVAITESQRRKIVRRCFRIQQEGLAH
jgi:c-di-GMP-binding flagellar brake protein YcgR